jgi:glutamate dehydrogenase/leucine dehydrogenase
MTNPFALADDLGPEKIIHIHDPSTGLKAILVIDNVAAGPSIGGCRMAVDVSLGECARLARAMTLKNAAASLPHGGGKSVIFGDPKMPAKDKERLVRSFAHAIKDIEDYIVGPDMGTDETCMAWCHDIIGRSVGLPMEIGGIPLDMIGATGFGLVASIEVGCEFADLDLNGARYAIQGFGSVGIHTARFLAERGAVLVGVSDIYGAIVNPEGIDATALIEHKSRGGKVKDFPGQQEIERDDLIDVECDIWVPAARPDVITVENVDRLKIRVLAQGANIPATPEAEALLEERGCIVLPDFIANAGGVICAAVEYHAGSQSQAMATIADKVASNTRTTLERSRAEGLTAREAAMKTALDRVRTAMELRKTS